jgi:hypothetical protein
MFPKDEWDTLVAEHIAPNALFVATDPVDGVVGFTAVHPREGAHDVCSLPGVVRLFSTRTKKIEERSWCMKPTATNAMEPCANRMSAAFLCGSRGW